MTLAILEGNRFSGNEAPWDTPPACPATGTRLGPKPRPGYLQLLGLEGGSPAQFGTPTGSQAKEMSLEKIKGPSWGARACTQRGRWEGTHRLGCCLLNPI